MRFCALNVLCATAILLLAAPAASAQDPDSNTEAEQLYLQLRRSSDHGTKLTGERWYGLVKLQPWKDASGQFETDAKYLEHDPELTWIKLRVVRTVDGQRVARDLTIPVDKLSKRSQSRVRQIAFLSDKVKQAAAEVENEATDDADADAADRTLGGPPSPAMDPGRGLPPGAIYRGPTDSRTAEPANEESMPVAEMAAARSTPPDASQTSDDAPPPLVMPAMSGESERDSVVAGGRGPEIAAAMAAEAPTTNAPWQTSYEAFRANFSAAMNVDEDLMEVDWGALETLSRVRIAKTRVIGSQQGGPPVPPAELPQALLDSVGEFTWGAIVTEPVSETANWATVLGLAPLPEPLTLELKLDTERGPGNWQSLAGGQPVRFVGRFTDMKGEHGIVASIRFLDDAPPAVESRR